MHEVAVKYVTELDRQQQQQQKGLALDSTASNNNHNNDQRVKSARQTVF